MKRSDLCAADPKATKQKVLTPDEAIKLRSKEKVTVQFKVAAVEDTNEAPIRGFGHPPLILLKDGDRFVASLAPPVPETLAQLGIDPTKHFSGKTVRVTGVVEPAGPSFYIVVNDLNQVTFVGE